MYYEVWEQWPRRLMATFLTLEKAEAYVTLNRHKMAMPIIIAKGT